ncbi:hypothetical protein Tco_0513501 [Tanacetum coccineum]
MALEHRSLKPELQGMTSGHISSGLDLTYALSTITSQKPTERDLELLFEAMYDDYMGGQPLDAIRTAPAAPATLNLQTPNTSTTTAENVLTPTNSSTKPLAIPNTSKDVEECSTRICSSILLLYHPQAQQNHLHNMWIRRTCIRSINRTNMNSNGLRITLWNK